MLFILFPLLAIIFLMGWVMYTIGDEPSKGKKNKTVTSPKEDHVHFMPNIPSVEKEIIAE